MIIKMLIILTYIILYCCIYNAVIVFTVTDSLGLNPEYKIADMPGTPYTHAYVSVQGVDLFVNPFREYGYTHTMSTTDEFKGVILNWGEFYIPVLDQFITVF